MALTVVYGYFIKALCRMVILSRATDSMKNAAITCLSVVNSGASSHADVHIT